MKTITWSAEGEFHIFEGNQVEYLETRSDIDLRLGGSFMGEIVKKIHLSITGAFVHYDTILESGEKEERYFAVENSQHAYVPEDKIKIQN